MHHAAVHLTVLCTVCACHVKSAVEAASLCTVLYSYFVPANGQHIQGQHSISDALESVLHVWILHRMYINTRCWVVASRSLRLRSPARGTHHNDWVRRGGLGKDAKSVDLCLARISAVSKSNNTVLTPVPALFSKGR